MSEDQVSPESVPTWAVDEGGGKVPTSAVPGGEEKVPTW